MTSSAIQIREGQIELPGNDAIRCRMSRAFP